MSALCLISITGYCQTIQSTSDPYSGMEDQMTNSRCFYLPLSSTEFLYAGARVNSNDVSLIKLTREYKTEWSIPELDGYLGAAKLGDDIIVFSAKMYKRMGISFNYLKSVHATLIDNSNGRIKGEKDVSTYSDKALMDILILTDAEHNFKYLMLRTTQQEKIVVLGQFKSEKQFGSTGNLQAISFDGNLNTKTLDFTGNAVQNGQFVSCCSNTNGDIFITTWQNNLLSISRYSAGSTGNPESITAKTNFENDAAVQDKGSIKIENNKILVCCKIDEEKKTASTIVSAVFDFDTKKSAIQQQLLDKDYLKQYDEKEGNAYPVGCEFYNDKLIFIKEIQSVQQRGAGSDFSSNLRYNPIIVSIYEDSMRLLKELQVDEDLRVFMPSFGSGYKILNNKLFFFYNYNKGKIGIQTRYQFINLDDFSSEQEQKFDVDARASTVLQGPGIIWFGNTGLFPFVHEESLLNPNKISTTFKTIQF